jgi:hypothetical protein
MPCDVVVIVERASISSGYASASWSCMEKCFLNWGHVQFNSSWTFMVCDIDTDQTSNFILLQFTRLEGPTEASTS